MGIDARGLTKAFGNKLAVRGLDLRVPPGEIFGLIGPNGAGKTTSLRMLAGLMRPTAGSASVCGHDLLTRARQARSQVGFLTGSTGLYERLTVRELLVYFGRLHGLTRQRVEQRMLELEQVLRFSDLRHRLCGKLSTGERQRVSLARALIHDPRVLVLDEPTAGLDVLASRFVAQVIRDARDRGRAVLFSTHYMTEAELLCDRVGLIHAGQLVWQGPPAELRRQTGAASLEQAFLGLIDGGQATDPEVGP